MKHRIIIHGSTECLSMAARAARVVLAPDYEWPADDVTVISFTDGIEDRWAVTFAVKRNKSSITIWEQE